VRGGYEPAVLRARVGEPVRIVFSREETAACSERVVFPAFGRSAMLPPFEDVSLELVPERAGEYEFTCQLGMLRGRLVVQGDAPSVVPAFDTVLVALATWLCTLPLLLLVGVPRLGWRGAGVSALLWLGVLATACFALCALRRSTGVGEDRRSLRRPLLHAIGTWPSRDLRRTGRH
jgi:hypothetical protein